MGGRGITVLVVEDEPSIRLLCRVNLELEGHRVLEAGSLAEARHELEANDVEVVLLDRHVGSEDGYELLRELRDRESGIRIALFTGSVEIGSEDRKIADAVLAKPFAIEELLSTVQGLAEVRSS
jgi:two-component system KDP operon response regulator KdpE